MYNCTRRSALLGLFKLTPSPIKMGPFTLGICTNLHLCLSVHMSSRIERTNAGNDCRMNWYVNVCLLHRLSRAFQFQIYRPLYEKKTKLNVQRIFLSVHKVNFHYTEWVCELGSVQYLLERAFWRRPVGIMSVSTAAPHGPILYTQAAENSVHTFDVMQWIVAWGLCTGNDQHSTAARNNNYTFWEKTGNTM